MLELERRYMVSGDQDVTSLGFKALNDGLKHANAHSLSTISSSNDFNPRPISIPT